MSDLTEKIVLPEELDATILKNFPHADKIPDAIIELLIRREITSEEQVNTFFKANINDILDPFLLSGMDKAVERIFDARLSGEKVLIYGDYDVDGITSTSLLLLYFREIFLDNVDFFIPNRMDDGYGLCNDAIDVAKKNNVNLIITVDCGISSITEVDYANEHNIDIIIVDHHIPSDTLPNAKVIINSKKPNDIYPNKDLSGVGTTFKLVQALYSKEDESLKSSLDVFKFLDIVALGTAADLVPVTGENRVLLKEGLLRLKTSSNEGIKAILKTVGLYDTELSTTSIVFKIAPLINAVGRMSDPKLGVELFLANNFTSAIDVANKMKSLNVDRQKLDRAITEDCIKRIEKEPNKYGEKVIIIDSKEWHIGVIGIVASRLVEKFNKPAIVITTADGQAKGSCRSRESLFDMHEAISACCSKLQSFGGHKYAAGVTLEPSDIDEFREQINEFATKNKNKNLDSNLINADIKLLATELNNDLHIWLKRLEPFGPGNMKPVFHSDDLSLAGITKVVGQNHLKFQIQCPFGVIDCIGFNFANKKHKLSRSNSFISIAYTLEENIWMGKRSLQLNLRGIE